MSRFLRRHEVWMHVPDSLWVEVLQYAEENHVPVSDAAVDFMMRGFLQMRQEKAENHHPELPPHH